jgi:hypothetical protein
MKRFRQYRDFLKREFSAHRVTIRCLPITAKRHGDCDLVDGRFVIRIERRLPEIAAIDQLTHEFAHVLSWDEWCRTEKHGPKYWSAHRKVYEKYEQWTDLTWLNK